MNKIIIFPVLLLFSLLVFSCKNKTKPAEGNQTTLASDSTLTAKVELQQYTFDFGKMKRGELVSHTFRIKNTGNKNLIIKNVESSCGCTTPKYDKKPIKPGHSGDIEVKFDSKGRHGKQYKMIHVYANIPEKVFTLIITADIIN